MAGGRDRADWVRNLQAHARATVELGGETHPGVARALAPETAEDQLARQLLVAKYGDEEDLDVWGRTALPVVIEFGEPDRHFNGRAQTVAGSRRTSRLASRRRGN